MVRQFTKRLKTTSRDACPAPVVEADGASTTRLGHAARHILKTGVGGTRLAGARPAKSTPATDTGALPGVAAPRPVVAGPTVVGPVAVTVTDVPEARVPAEMAVTRLGARPVPVESPPDVAPVVLRVVVRVEVPRVPSSRPAVVRTPQGVTRLAGVPGPRPPIGVPTVATTDTQVRVRRPRLGVALVDAACRPVHPAAIVVAPGRGRPDKTAAARLAPKDGRGRTGLGVPPLGAVDMGLPASATRDATGLLVAVPALRADDVEVGPPTPNAARLA